MILYFSGTGNSRHIALRLAEALGDEAVSVNDRIKRGDFSPVAADGRVIFVSPTYGWRFPRVFESWLRKSGVSGADRVWFVMDCGSEIGNAAKYNRRLCDSLSLKYMGTAQILMPENYIAMFNAPGEAEAKKIIAGAEPYIDAAIKCIAEGREFPSPRCNLLDRFLSAAVNPIFYALFVKADAFRVDERCIGCGKCERLCPLNNIRLVDGRPVWGHDCTHCMACICHCPVSAIEYGRKSIGKPRYHCD